MLKSTYGNYLKENSLLKQHRFDLRIIHVVLFCVIGVFSINSVRAQEPPTGFFLESSNPGDYEGFYIDSVVVENRNIYDTEDPRYAGFLFRMTNRLHVVTREKIIRQELLFEKGQQLVPDAIEETARN
ncbi:MAG: hypothetical protein DRP45_03585, partial [Candidatus Zixiibacteriota bacterium]